jgi:hypothetical protein
VLGLEGLGQGDLSAVMVAFAYTMVLVVSTAVAVHVSQKKMIEQTKIDIKEGFDHAIDEVSRNKRDVP